ncbi:ACP S-malonyltransferase [Paraneptunicella aestuarii]|uniref:ACP S-malonyltransferase n=1 Tax=Paraneptunicella aestuarii TaxID=2831148 RepID=UPI001E49BA9D|nr:ACP S-malonyltransferase [Paraneptunicella aestuarii]UAA40408.1 ACP S-malonyltransferase [Paraneptunicella aestuarii]
MSKTAFVFPGQGSQTVGMMSDMAEAYPSIQESFAEASDALGFDLWKVVQEGPLEELNKTSITQPALLTASVAIWREYCAQGGAAPDFIAGHSLGEYTALTCAGVFTLADAASLVHARGTYMQQAVPEGAGSMAAIIGLDDDKVVELCEEVAEGQVVSAVNFNSPGQVVIAGHAEAVDRAIKGCKAKGARMGMPLPVSVPCHCSLMQDAAGQLADKLNATPMNSPVIPVINNVDVAIVSDVDGIRDALIRQLYGPVRWTETIQKLASEGVTNIIECGPGKVLSGLTKRIDKSIGGTAINTPDSLTAVLNK